MATGITQETNTGLNLSGGGSLPYSATGAYWIGQDGQAYIKAAGQPNVVAAPVGELQYFSNLAQIPDPNAPAGSSSASSGGGSSAPAPNYAAIRANVGATQGGYEAGARTGLTDVTNKYNSDVQSFLDNAQDQQDQINQGRVTNQLNLRRTMGNIVQGVRNGLRSGGVMLANSNATDSGATDDLARAWSQVGNTQSQSATNQAGVQDQTLDTSQSKLKRLEDETLGNFGTYRDTEINRARADLLNKLQVLDAQAQGQGVSGAVDMGIVDRVINDAVARLAGINSTLTQRLGSVNPLGMPDVLAKALQMDQIGAAATPFEVAPVGNNGPSGTPVNNLPIFIRRKELTA